MPGEKIQVTLDAQAVAGLLLITEALQDVGTGRGMTNLVEEIRSTRLALIGALRANGWTPTGNGDWEKRGTRRGR